MGAREICHFLAVVHFLFGCYYDWNYVKLPDVSPVSEDFYWSNGKLRFLTYWNAILQGFFYSVCLVNDFVGSNEEVPRKTPLIRKFKDILLTSLAFPISMFVGITFWGLYFVDRELIFPKFMDDFFPVWLNHVMHTNIMIFIILELMTSFRRYPSRKRGLTVLTAVMVGYLIWLHVIFYNTGVWVYPIFRMLNLPLRIAFFLTSLGLIVLSYLLGETLNKVVWHKNLKVSKRS